MTSQSDLDALEREIERARLSLGGKLDRVSDRLSVEQLATDALGLLRSGPSGRAATAARTSPLAVALAGAGLAWLLQKNRTGGDGPTSARLDDLGRWEGEGGQTLDPAAAEFIAAEWTRGLEGLRNRAATSLRRIEDEARAHLADARDGVADGYGAARDFAAERAAVVAEFSEALQQRLSHGLETLSDEARQKVIAARERAYSARLNVERAGRGAVAEPARIIEEHPLVAATVALAIGATLGALLPRSRTEDRYFGAESDRLMKEASDLLRREQDRTPD